MKKIYKILTTMLAILMLFSATSVSALSTPTEVDWESKVSAELLEVMGKKSDTDLIPVYIWLNDIDHDIINKAMIKEKGMDPAVYENEERFKNEIVPQIEAQIVARVGYEEAHRSNETSEYILDENGAYHDDTMSLVDRAIQAKETEYILAKRSISKREISSLNEEFISTHVNKERKIINVGKYVSCIIIEANKEEIKKYASLREVSDLSLYVDHPQVCSLAVSLDQTEAGYDGTKGSSYNNGNGFKGTGIKIGIIEGDYGCYDSSSPHLSSISGSRLFLVNNAGDNGAALTEIVSDHATFVTSIVVGQAVTVESKTYEGVAPLATVYQTPINHETNLQNALNNMADIGVTVINYSGGFSTGTAYDDCDRFVDQFIRRTGVILVVAAGNNRDAAGNVYPDHVLSPGKALNAITVGNADTILSTAVFPKAAPFSINETSCFEIGSWLPNKPDIVAPGTNIRMAYMWNGSVTTYSTLGRSLAAPIITGIIAQIQQAGSLAFRIYPALVKSVLITGAEPSKIKTATSTPADTSNPLRGTFLWEKSGAGLVNASRSMNIITSGGTWNYSFFRNQGDSGQTTEKYFSEGQHLRVTVTFDTTVTDEITSYTHLNDIDLGIVGPNGNVLLSNSTSYDNVVVLDYIIPTSGNYKFKISCSRIAEEGDLYYYYSWLAE